MGGCARRGGAASPVVVVSLPALIFSISPSHMHTSPRCAHLLHSASAPDVSMEGDVDEATEDLKAGQKSLCELITIVWTSISSESSELFRDFSIVCASCSG